MRLSPRARVGTSLITIGAAHLVTRRFDEGVPILLLTIQEDPSFPSPYRHLAACYAHMGRLDEARAIIRQLRALPRCGDPGHQLSAESRAPRAFPVGPAARHRCHRL